MSSEGEHKIISVLFTDVVNYTSLAEKLDLEVVRDIMNNHFKLLIEAVNRYGGTVDQLLGDGMVVFFGAPVACEDHVQRACYTALAMQDAVKQYAEKIQQEYGIDFTVRIGINSGPVLVGPIGDAQHIEYIAIGDTVNLASRLEEASRPGGILVSENIYSMVKEFFQFEPIGEVGIKGKERPVNAYRLLKSREIEWRLEAAAARGLTRFVGRENEIRSLQEAFDKSCRGSSQIVGITGEPGIGKSRLLREFREGLGSQESSCLEGHCLHYGTLIPYRPWIDILKMYFDIQGKDTETDIKNKIARKAGQLDETLNDYLPFLHEMLSLKADDEHFMKMENQYKRSKLFEGITNLLFIMSSEKPLIVAIEDLHWLDKASEDFLTYLTHRLINTRIFLILLYRPEYHAPWINSKNFREIHMSQLSTSTSNELLDTLLSGGKPDSGLKEVVLSKTGGNPLFVEELVHTLLDNGSIHKTGEKYTLNSLDSTIRLPDTIQGIIAARVDRLPVDLKNTLQVASVIGREFTYPVLHDVIKMREELNTQLETLQQLEFIVPKANSQDMTYIFKHALIQEVVYNSLLQKRRRELHESIAQSIERRYRDRTDEVVEVLAFHYQQSNSADKAIEYLRRSGRKALKQFAIEASHEYYRQAFKAISTKTDPGLEDQSVLLDIVLDWAEVYYYRGYFKELLQLLNSHKGVAEFLGDKSRQAMLSGWLGNILFISGRITESYQYLRQALELAETSNNLKAAAYIYAWLAWTCLAAGKIDEGIAYGEKAVQASQQLDEAYPYIKASGGMGNLLSSKGKIQKALEYASDLLEFGQTRGNIRSLALGYYISSMCHINAGELLKAIEESQKGLDLNVDQIYRGMLKTSLGYALFLNGRFAEAEREFQEIVAGTEKLGGEIVGWSASAFLAISTIRKGRMKEGFNRLEEFRRITGEEIKQNIIFYEYLQGLLYANLAAPPDLSKMPLLFKNVLFILKHSPFAARKAIRHYRKCAAVSQESGYTSFSGLAYLEIGRLYARNGSKALARENLSTAAKLFSECEGRLNLKQANEMLDSLEKNN